MRKNYEMIIFGKILNLMDITQSFEKMVQMAMKDTEGIN